MGSEIASALFKTDTLPEMVLGRWRSAVVNAD